MQKLITILFILSIGFISCKDKKQISEKDTVDQKTVEVAQNPAKDSMEIRKVITEFYDWYNKNYTKFLEYNLYNGIKKKDVPPYKINWDVVEKYHAFIRKEVKELGEEFIKNQKNFLQQCDSAFKVDVEDEIPYGFDYDWYTNSQEDPKYLLDEMNKSKKWIINVNGNDATADIKGPYNDNGKQSETTIIKLAMKKENDKWKIAKIGMDQ